MADIRTVGVKELKDNLSAYLREVRRGVRVLVTDRDRVIAEIREPGARYEASDDENPILNEWIAKGIVTPPSRRMGPVPRSPITSPEGTAEQLLKELRKERF
ncbi:MAG TPA: hypothetical protein VMR65_04910 [Candidatus Sulfotelmatobacter sp.]|jgi:antitoxin (DNA-binding transcriptional repressor) of toxin-antitoxin stability system|nr:hypothetical protein [Candidatus Sulfotelmatobacter sp.]